MDRPQFSKLTVIHLIETSSVCHSCSTLIAPFTVAYVRALSVERPNVGKILCESCKNKEVEARIRVSKDFYEQQQKKVG